MAVDATGAPALFHVVVMDDRGGFAVRMTRGPLPHAEAITFRDKLLPDARRGRGRWSTVVPVDSFTPCPSLGCGNGWAFRQVRAPLCPDCALDVGPAVPATVAATPVSPQPASVSPWLFDADIDFGDHD